MLSLIRKTFKSDGLAVKAIRIIANFTNMNTKSAYNAWASQYDTNINPTRDLEAKALQLTLQDVSFKNCLEIGCGTGKNTDWLINKANQITAVDFSEEMLAKARAKIVSDRVEFIQADVTKDWILREGFYDLVTFSLVLEHIEHLEPIFKQVASSLRPGGMVYIGELHPFKQYSGSKARFDTEEGQQVLECFTHHISEFTTAAKKQGLVLMELQEYFDHEDKSGVPRILALLLRKP